jgi:hypothetical protein
MSRIEKVIEVASAILVVAGAAVAAARAIQDLRGEDEA